MASRDQPDAIAARLGLVPLPAEGGRFRRTWSGPEDASGRPAGSAILMLLTDDPDGFSALHRLPIDEVWHFYRGDAMELLLLHPDGSDELRRLGDGEGVGVGDGDGDGDGEGEGDLVQTVVTAGTWMGARVAPGGTWSLFGTTMAPGFLPADYEGGDADDLACRYPSREALIRALCRPGAPTRMPEEDDR